MLSNNELEREILTVQFIVNAVPSKKGWLPEQASDPRNKVSGVSQPF
jgi:hypothetical protein